MSLNDMADEIIRKQREKALSRREEAESNYCMLAAQALDGMSDEDKAELARLEQKASEALDAMRSRCEACPNADICIASIRNACPHFIRMEVTSRRRDWHEFLKAKAHFCGGCDSCESSRCWCSAHNKVVEQDTPACADVFPSTLAHGPASDPDPLWFPDRPLSPKEQEQRKRSHRETAERLARVKRENPDAYASIVKMDRDRYEAYEKEFPELFGGTADGQS